MPKRKSDSFILFGAGESGERRNPFSFCDKEESFESFEKEESTNKDFDNKDSSASPQNGNPKTKARIYYYDIGDYKSREEKLNILANCKSIEGLEGRFQTITPNKDYDWINQRDYSFMAYIPLGNIKTKLKPLAEDSKGNKELEIFHIFSQGILTSRDAWCVNFSKQELEKNMRICIDTFNEECEKFKGQTLKDYENLLCRDTQKISWSDSLKQKIKQGILESFTPNEIIVSMYRPFCKQVLYYDKTFNHRPSQMPSIFPLQNNTYLPNLTICINGLGGSKEFASLMADRLTEYGTLSNSQCFPLYYYEKLDSTMSKEESLLNGISEAEYKQMQDNPHSNFYRRKDAIRDEALDKFREVYKAFWEIHPEYKAPHNIGDSTLLLSQMRNCSFTKESKAFQARGEGSLVSLNDRAESAESAIYRCEISKDSIFYYLYALLNHPTYKEKYKDNLSKMLPRIPFMKDFWGFENAGRALAQLHLNYESFAEACLDSSNGAFACLKSKINDFKGQNLFHPKEEAIRDIQALQEKDFTINKLRFEAKGKLDTIIFNDNIAIVHIPLKAYEYKVNGKSGIEWIMDRYQVKIDKDSHIPNDPNLYECEEGALKGLKGGKYVLYLLLSVIEMSVRTMKTLESLPAYEVIEG
uniref:Type ISP restriction-modification enzyme LLaBIII C-terminal specificity domain-containing protein n=1 Tax=uncultured Helicobacter sp. TaxID=175537 RepID=A0A650EMJ9_9HELI|nr:hypothetical protein Helico4rc_2240 [uncultured Helicobacter sp.]